jgi:hypothetical protein
VAAIDATRAALRAVPPTDPQARERAIAAALATFDAESPAAAPSDLPAAPAHRVGAGDLAERRRARHGTGGRRVTTPRWLAAAAAAAVLAGVAGVIAVADRGDDQDTASQSAGGSAADHESQASDATGDEAPAETFGESSGSGGEGGRGDASAADSGDDRAAAAEVGDLGSFVSDSDLVARIAAIVPTDAQRAAPTSPPSSEAELAITGCAPDDLPAPLDDPDVPRQLYGTARLEGAPVQVWVAEAPGGPRVVALGEDCAVLVDRPLA